MENRPTRRDALKTIAAGAAGKAGLTSLAALPAAAQTAETYQPQALSPSQFETAAALVEMIIPASDTPGAAAAGVHRYIDEELADDSERKTRFLAGLEALSADGFGQADENQRVLLLTKYSQADGARGAFFRLLKNLTIDGYYGSEAGLVDELGYKGNGYLREFPGCRHEEHI